MNEKPASPFPFVYEHLRVCYDEIVRQLSFILIHLSTKKEKRKKKEGIGILGMIVTQPPLIIWGIFP
jgi:hypothetical protein